MLELHIANKNYSSWSLRPWLLMRALDIPFVERVHYFGSPAGFSQISPNSKLPVLQDGDWCIWDSMAITEYLAELFRVFGRLKRKNGPGHGVHVPRCMLAFKHFAVIAR